MSFLARVYLCLPSLVQFTDTVDLNVPQTPHAHLSLQELVGLEYNLKLVSSTTNIEAAQASANFIKPDELISINFDEIKYVDLFNN